VIADHDRKVNPQWPWPDETPATRARRLARAYRAVAARADPHATRTVDQRAAGWGETWMLDTEQTVDDDRELTTAEAAELVNVAPQTIRKWACLNHPEQPGRKLLPRFGRRGRETLYIAADVRAAAAALIRTQHARTWS
jgi:hypothetical protein